VNPEDRLVSLICEPMIVYSLCLTVVTNDLKVWENFQLYKIRWQSAMAKLLFNRNAKIGYGVALIFLFLAGGLYIADYNLFGGAAAGAAVSLALNTASAHGHLTKRDDNNKSI